MFCSTIDKITKNIVKYILFKIAMNMKGIKPSCKRKNAVAESILRFKFNLRNTWEQIGKKFKEEND